jgi:hypothetical protein
VPIHSFASLSLKTTGEFSTSSFQPVPSFVLFCPDWTLPALVLLREQSPGLDWPLLFFYASPLPSGMGVGT